MNSWTKRNDKWMELVGLMHGIMEVIKSTTDDKSKDILYKQLGEVARESVANRGGTNK